MNEKLKSVVPLYMVVGAAAMDMYEDMAKVEEQYSHWAGRGLNRLIRNRLLRATINKVILHVNPNTHTATLPCDFKRKRFVGVINGGRKIPMMEDASLVDSGNIKEEPCADKCPRCAQTKSICEEMNIMDDAEFAFSHNNTIYYKTTTKRLYDSGDFYEEVSTPFLDTESGVVGYKLTKRFVEHLDKKDCGCLETTKENISKIRKCNDLVYCAYYTDICDCCDPENGVYRIFPETGLIQLSPESNIRKIYLEYEGFMIKVKGQYMIPEIAFDVLVEWTKWKSMQNRKGITQYEKDSQFKYYAQELNNMKLATRRVNMSVILQAVLSVPKFDINFSSRYCCRS